jgi:hypothetical protein
MIASYQTEYKRKGTRQVYAVVAAYAAQGREQMPEERSTFARQMMRPLPEGFDK